MRLRDYIFDVAPKAVGYELARRGIARPPNPLTITYSVTAACRSLCKTCNIGRVYLKEPERAERDLSLEEIEKIFKSLGPVYFFNVSGGEPFMRMDLAEIHRLAFLYLKPKLISIPTNSLAPRAVDLTTRKILNYMDEYLPSSVTLSIKPSIDGVGEMHDYVRGIKGNFIKLEETIDRLLAIKKTHPRLQVDVGTVISNFNLHHLPVLENWVHHCGVGAYRHEIAEQRVEFHNIGDPITPSPEVYERLTREFAEKIVRNIKNKAFLTRTTEAVRLAYYHVAVHILQERRQVTPCYGGLANIHLNYDGEMWPCCILGGEQSMGNVRDWDYDVKGLLASDQAQAVIAYIAGGNCACPLASQWLNNVLLTPRHLLRVLYNLFVRFPLAPPSDPETASPPVSPKDIHVNLSGTSPRPALVLHKAGTVPKPEAAELPQFGSSDARPAATVSFRKHDDPGTGEMRCQVVQVRPLSDSTYLLRIERPRNFDFIPGQYCIIGKPESFDAREYTIYSSIHDDFLEFLITQVNGGIVSNALRYCQPGDTVALDGPMGYFRLHEQGPNTSPVFIATGSGIAPFHSVIRSYPALNYTLLHGVRFAHECYEQDRYSPDRYISCVSREPGGHFQGRVTDYLRQHPVTPGSVWYTCGNNAMIFEVYDILVQQGIPRRNIRTEGFY